MGEVTPNAIEPLLLQEKAAKFDQLVGQGSHDGGGT